MSTLKGHPEPWAFGRCAACGFGAPLFWRPPLADLSAEAALGRACPACGGDGALVLTLGAGVREAYREWLGAAATTASSPSPRPPGREPPPENPSIPVEALQGQAGVPLRLIEGLRRVGVRDLAEVGECSVAEFMRLPGFGRKTLGDLLVLCARFGVRGPVGASPGPASPEPTDPARARRAPGGAGTALGPWDLSAMLDALGTLLPEVLDERSARIVGARFGIGIDDPAATWQAIGDRHGITRERVRQLVDRSLIRLKAALQLPRTEAARFLALDLRPRLPGTVEELAGKMYDLAGYMPTVSPAETAWWLTYLLGPRGLGFRPMRDLVRAAIRERLRQVRLALKEARRSEAKRRIAERILSHAWWPASPARFSAERPPLPRIRAREVQEARPGRITGSFESERDGYGQVAYESTTELAFLRVIDASPAVSWYAEQPVEVPFEDHGWVRRTFPDVLLVADDGRALLVEVTPVVGMFWAETLRKALAARAFAEERGWGFALSTSSGLTLAEIAAMPFDPHAAADLLGALDAAGGALHFADFRPLRDRHGLGPTALGTLCVAHDLAIRVLPGRSCGCRPRRPGACFSGAAPTVGAPRQPPMPDARVGSAPPCSGGTPNASDAGEVRLPYGQAADGRLLHVSEVPSGLACGCVCPGCGARLVAKKGQIQEHHFAHHASRACVAAYETMLHRLAKQVIAERRLVRLPAVEAGHADMPTRVLRGETEFRPDEVALEKAMDGMRPDIVARKAARNAVRELLIEVSVTHPCGPEKIERIRAGRMAAIEIDLSGVPRDAPREEMENAIVSVAPRQWLFNELRERAVAELAAEAQAREEATRRRAEAALRDRASKLANAWAAALATARTRTPGACGASLVRVREAGLGHAVGIGVAGGACFAVTDAAWQAAILDGLAIWGRRPGNALIKVGAALDLLRDAGLIRPGLSGFIDEDVENAARALAPDFRAPHEAVRAYMEALEGRGIIAARDRGWIVPYEVSEGARRKLEAAAAARKRVSDLERRLGSLLERLPDGIDVNPAEWMATRHDGLPATPRRIAAEGGQGHGRLLAIMERLEAMLAPGGPAEELLLGLQLERHLEMRRCDLEIRRREREAAEEERRRAEEERARRSAAKAREESVGRRRDLERRAVALLGYEEGRRWLAGLSDWLGGMSAATLEGLTAEQMSLAERSLSAEHARQVEEGEREARIRALRDRLREEAEAFLGPELAEFWMKSQNTLLGLLRPAEACVDDGGLERCREALWQDARRFRRG